MCSQGAVKQQTRQVYLGTFFRISAFMYKFPCLTLCPPVVPVKKITLQWRYPWQLYNFSMESDPNDKSKIRGKINNKVIAIAVMLCFKVSKKLSFVNFIGLLFLSSNIPLYIKKIPSKNYIRFWKWNLKRTPQSVQNSFSIKSNLKFNIKFNMISFTNPYDLVKIRRECSKVLLLIVTLIADYGIVLRTCSDGNIKGDKYLI